MGARVITVTFFVSLFKYGGAGSYTEICVLKTCFLSSSFFALHDLLYHCSVMTANGPLVYHSLLWQWQCSLVFAAARWERVGKVLLLVFTVASDRRGLELNTHKRG